jgi:hypothetical protein
MKGKIAYLIDESCGFEDEDWVFYEEDLAPSYRMQNPNKVKRIVYFEVA